MADKVKVPAVHAQAAAGNVDLHYTPQDMEMKHDSFFAEMAPGVANSGNLAYKHGAPGDHSISTEDPTGLKGD